MVPGSPSMCGDTYGSRMTRTYLWADMVLWFNIREDSVSYTMKAYHRTSCGNGVPLCSEGRIVTFYMRSSLTHTIALAAQIKSRFISEDSVAVHFQCDTTPIGGEGE
ncbi:hypothetical protein TNCV_2746301 [Trichonephila clavipes]|nr:hypothetical protein TNCV_2746301 [Trichonephila clavipes]